MRSMFGAEQCYIHGAVVDCTRSHALPQHATRQKDGMFPYNDHVAWGKKGGLLFPA